MHVQFQLQWIYTQDPCSCMSTLCMSHSPTPMLKSGAPKHYSHLSRFFNKYHSCNPFHRADAIWGLRSSWLLKTLWQKDKLLINPKSLSRKQTLSDAFASRGLLKNIAQNKQFLLLPHCFQPFSVITPTFKEIFRDFALPLH